MELEELCSPLSHTRTNGYAVQFQGFQGSSDETIYWYVTVRHAAQNAQCGGRAGRNVLISTNTLRASDNVLFCKQNS